MILGRSSQTMGSTGSFRCIFSNFSKQTANRLCSDVFTSSGFTWRLLIYPKGNKTNHLSIYLQVLGSAILPRGWSREILFGLTLVNELNPRCTSNKVALRRFTESKSEFGFASFISLTALHDHTKGYLANDTLMIDVVICTLPGTPAVNTCSAELIHYFGTDIVNLDESIEEAQTSGVQAGSSLHSRDVADISQISRSVEVEKAKQSLKECLTDVFKMNIGESLSSALSNLSSARSKLATEQCEVGRKFLANFDKFTSDFLIFEQDKAELELHKIEMDRKFLALKKCHETHTLYKQLLEDITREEGELEREMKQLQCMKEELLSNWEVLLVESKEASSGYNEEKKKVVEAEEKKRIAEERMSRSATAFV